MFDWSGVYFKKVVHAPTSLIALGYVAFMSTMALGRFLGDGFTAKIGIQKMLQLSGAIIMLGLLLAVFFPNVPMATIGFLLVGGGVSSVVPLVYSTAGKSKRMQPGAALAAVSSIGFIGFLIGPPMIGFIAQQAGLRYSFALIALLGLGTSIVATLNKRW
jgi:MFS family permease